MARVRSFVVGLTVFSRRNVQVFHRSVGFGFATAKIELRQTISPSPNRSVLALKTQIPTMHCHGERLTLNHHRAWKHYGEEPEKRP